MMNRSITTRLALAMAAALTLALTLTLSAQAQEPDAVAYTKEQLLLFGTRHLENIDSKAVLHYDFRQSGSRARAIEDRVTLEIKEIDENGGKHLSTRFLNGDEQRDFGDIRDFRSNPLIMYFLQWDVEKMDNDSRLSHHHYRHLLRRAIRVGTHSKEVTITHEQRKLQGHKVFFRPLTSKEDDERYGNYAGKRYEFILAETIPGYIYSISTLIPGEQPDDEPLEFTRLTFNRLEPAGSKK